MLLRFPFPLCTECRMYWNGALSLKLDSTEWWWLYPHGHLLNTGCEACLDLGPQQSPLACPCTRFPWIWLSLVLEINILQWFFLSFLCILYFLFTWWCLMNLWAQGNMISYPSPPRGMQGDWRRSCLEIPGTESCPWHSDSGHMIV